MQRWIAALLAVGACSAPERASPTPAPRAAVPADAAAAVGVGVAVVAPPDAQVVAPDAGPTMAVHIELTFMGDIIFGGLFNDKWSPSDAENHDPLAEVAALMKSDLALANLETTVLDEIPKMTGTKRFVATPAQVALLPKNGINAVTLANNHINDVDGPGVAVTADNVRATGLLVIGAPREEAPLFRVETIEVRGWKIGFIAATTKLNRHQKKTDPQVPFVKDPLDLKDLLLPVIAAAKLDHDLVIHVLHWGVQYQDQPEDWQVEAAHAFIDAGAAAVIGHHPHVLQGIERYKDGLIAYSLGNYVFQNGESPPRYTGILRVGYTRASRCLDLALFHPAVIKRQPVHHPIPATGTELAEIDKRLLKLSKAKPLATTWTADGDHFVTTPACVAVP
jgi:poly-gamma-glutamate synthesis protein (capsule biosynthesis protein)